MAMGVVVILMFGGESMMVTGQMGCRGDMQGLITQCAVKEIEQIVDMDKVFHLASSCGRPLAHGTKCGSSTVP
ncbi:hypothetical protein FNV43_RR21546 [Rhamnella rubrinervis]|uniref:Uncharacterized protein n=1 Tax=Rhamnella rubrinervis TaxID=2594499 RepID=A0A8K0E1V8_9ROSA|nr:hypothetical protein FNV43_RR21546 [Rhamnella rubrinervis]